MKFALALDIQEKDKLIKIIEETYVFVDFFKVGPIALFSFGLEIFKYISRVKKEVFLDMKFFDIPSVVSRTISSLSDLGVRVLTVHALGGKGVLKSAVLSAKNLGIEIAAVTKLTSDNADLRSVLELSEIAESCGATWVVSQPQFSKYIKSKTKLKVISPGIRISESRDEHKNTLTPYEAKLSGIDMIVVGRPIVLSDNPYEQAKKVREMIDL